MPSIELEEQANWGGFNFDHQLGSAFSRLICAIQSLRKLCNILDGRYTLDIEVIRISVIAKAMALLLCTEIIVSVHFVHEYF